MKIHALHRWDLSPGEAIALQQRLRRRVRLTGSVRRPRWVAGTDVAFPEGGRQAHAVVVVLELPGFHLHECVEITRPVTFPYVPGLLSFRESPILLECFRRLQTVPDAVLVDGQGQAHPRRLGIASHLGLWLNVPTVGVAKSRLCGVHRVVPDRAGAQVPLRDHGAVIGAVLRSRPGTRPLYVSVGHGMSLRHALDLVTACLAGYRLPEPTRIADRCSKM